MVQRLIVSRIATSPLALLTLGRLDRATNCQSLRIPTLCLLRNSLLDRRARTSSSRPPAFHGEPYSLRWFWSDRAFLNLGNREILTNVLPIQFSSSRTGQVAARFVLQHLVYAHPLTGSGRSGHVPGDAVGVFSQRVN